MSVANLITVLQPGGQTQPRDLSSQLEAVLSYIKGAQGSKAQIPADFNQVLSQLMGPDLEQKDAGLSLDGKKAKDLESLVHSLIKGDSALDSTALVSNLQALLQQLQVLTQPVIGISPQVQSQVSGQILKSNDIVNHDVTKVPLNGSSQSSPSGLDSRLGQYALDAAPPVSSDPSHLTSLVNANPLKGADKENGLGVVFENPPQTDSSLYPIGSAHLSALPGLSANLADFRQFLPEFKIKQETSTPSTLQGVLGTNLSSSPTQQVSVASVQHVGAAFGSPVWPDDFSQKIVLLAGQQTHVANLHLNPPDLGPVQVHLSVHQGEVNAVFLSHQAGVRDAIVAAMPRLRAQMDASGMTLGQAQVSSDNSGRQSGQSQPGYTFSYHSGAGRMADNNSQGFALAFSALGLVDMFV